MADVTPTPTGAAAQRPIDDLTKRAKAAIYYLRNGGDDDPYVVERPPQISGDDDEGWTEVRVSDDYAFCSVAPNGGQPELGTAEAIAGAGKLIADLLAERDALAAKLKDAEATVVIARTDADGYEARAEQAEADRDHWKRLNKAEVDGRVKVQEAVGDAYHAMNIRAPIQPLVSAIGYMVEQHGRALARETKLREALTELVATVRGECPSLLNEDSGGSAVLIGLLLDVDALDTDTPTKEKP